MKFICSYSGGRQTKHHIVKQRLNCVPKCAIKFKNHCYQVKSQHFVRTWKSFFLGFLVLLDMVKWSRTYNLT